MTQVEFKHKLGASERTVAYWDTDLGTTLRWEVQTASGTTFAQASLEVPDCFAFIRNGHLMYFRLRPAWHQSQMSLIRVT